MTIALIERDEEILLPLKKTGFGAGYYNGPGGKDKPRDENNPQLTCKREVFEEVGLDLLTLDLIGEIEFRFTYKPETHQVFIYRATHWRGLPRESSEMRPEWFNKSKIPYEQMFAADRIWLPRALRGEVVNGWFLYKKGFELVDSSFK